MATATVGTKNQIVIPKAVRAQVKGLKPGEKVQVYSLDDQTVAIKLDGRDWYERTHGIAAEAWKDIDTTKYLDELRDEWER